MPYIYKITNTINQKVYIGKTLKTVEKRWQEHIRDSRKRDEEKRPLYSAFKKYGIENFSIEVIEECESSILEEREKYWIEFYGSFKYGYNATTGGDGRPYVDRELVIGLYQEYGTCLKVHQMTGYDSSTISSILKEKGIPIKTGADHVLERYGKKVIMLDSKTNEPLQVFDSLLKAAKYLKDIGITTAKEKSISTNIGRVAQGKRQTAYTYKWKLI